MQDARCKMTEADGEWQTADAAEQTLRSLTAKPIYVAQASLFCHLAFCILHLAICHLSSVICLFIRPRCHS
jgi:hypothetical protein